MIDFQALAKIDFEDQAKEYRTKWNTPKGGLIVFDNFGEACGWINRLRDPEHWEPGCVAIDESGCRWKAMGGNNYDGAESWELCQ